MAAVISSLRAGRVRGATGTVCLCGTEGEGNVNMSQREAETFLELNINLITCRKGCGFGDGVLSFRDCLENQIPVGLLGWRESRSDKKKYVKVQ